MSRRGSQVAQPRAHRMGSTNRVPYAGPVLGEPVSRLVDGLHDFAEGFCDVSSAHPVPLGVCYMLREGVWAAEPSRAATP